MNPDQIILSGSLLLAIPLAALAGLVSFLSPCVLPLVPGYLGFVSGMVGKSPSANVEKDSISRQRILLGTLLFVLGFSAVFVSYGSLFGALGSLIYGRNGQILQQVLGGLIVVLGLVMMGQFAWLQRSIKPSWSPRAGLIGAPILGIAFALGWTPCIGPTLSAVLSLAASTGSALRGSILAFAYSLGLGLPFLAIAAGLGWAAKSVNVVRKNIRVFNLIGGGLIVVLGLLMATGIWNLLIAQIQEAIVGYLPAL
jgi:cytochrome c-type biogenesis protein